MGFLDHIRPPKPDVIDADVIDSQKELDFFSALGAMAVPRPQTVTDHTRKISPVAPGQIGTNVTADLNFAPKDAIGELSESFPCFGMEPEQKAQMNLAAKLSDKAAADAKFYKEKGKVLADNMAEVYEYQTEHKANMFAADLKTKKADVKYLGAVQHWQTETMSLVDKAREQHAGIEIAANCL